MTTTDRVIKVTVCGACGRMGGKVLARLHSDPDFSIGGAVERQGHPAVGTDLGRPLGLNERLTVTADCESALAASDALVDFTQADAAIEHLEIAARLGKPAVVGTTGFSENQKKAIGEVACRIPLVVAPNMSVGVNVLFVLAREAARLLGPEYDPEVLEIHHDLKKDAPSGTALRLAELVAAERGWSLNQVARHGRRGMVGERSANELGLHAIRGGDVVGDHTVFFLGQGERLELTHRSQSRDSYVSGVLRALKFVVEQKPGLYDFVDVLGLKKK